MLMPVGRERSDAEETVRYIGDLAGQLRSLATKQDLGFLGYLLAMVEKEARDTVRTLGSGKTGGRAAA